MKAREKMERSSSEAHEAHASAPLLDRSAPVLSHRPIDALPPMKLRIGFLGLGAMGLSHVKSMRRLCGDKAEVAAICDLSPANLQSGIEAAPGAKAYKEAAELIHAPLDAIIVSTPNFTHAKLAADILAAGKHLFLEKPCGITSAECHEVLNIANASDRGRMLGHE